ncbi:hypothetical protein C482_11373 [Natrialba chahannaoensis JCM 10990]|uniref:Flagellin n=1 Tax=Natrialba chahannaoensis JCM 10990 TaxID=1227492 RepID=M0AK11_9EURY|nr:hypothetical protein [Natrialba chahannaoensis]ELY98874.1 hypothetical protein C482_11373 [Natrialba chahannaoensis JCM 10990]
MSIAVTHVLTIGITTILIAMLLTSAGGLLDTETDRSAERSLETIGERIAGEVESADQLADEDDSDVTITAAHPRTVANSGYTVALREDCEGPLLDGETDCIQLTASNADAVVYVPFTTERGIDESEVSGGTIEIETDGTEIWLTGGNR